MKKLAYVLGALALAVTSTASVGCILFLMDEPTSPKSIID